MLLLFHFPPQLYCYYHFFYHLYSCLFTFFLLSILSTPSFTYIASFLPPVSLLLCFLHLCPTTTFTLTFSCTSTITFTFDFIHTFSTSVVPLSYLSLFSYLYVPLLAFLLLIAIFTLPASPSMLTQTFLIPYTGGINGTVEARLTAGQQIKRVILYQGHDSLQNSSCKPRLFQAQYSLRSAE